MRLLLVALALLVAVAPALALDGVKSVSDRVSKHYDPGHLGHMHKCASCGAMYHQPGDGGPGTPGSYRCGACGYNNSPAMPNPPVNPPYQPPQPPYPGQPGQPPQPVDPTQDPQYQAGYAQGHADGFREAYSQGFQDGRRAGEQEGRQNGERDGYNRFLERYTGYVYTREKLKDLINGLQLPPQGRFEAIVDPPAAPSLPGLARYGGPNFTRGYNDGLYAGRREGRDKGFWDGRSETYDRVYREAFKVGSERANRDMHTANGRVLTMEEQLRIGLDHHARGEWAKARLRFNLVLLEAGPADARVRSAARWYAADSLMREGDADGALAVFCLHQRENPREMLELTSLNIAKLLLEVKTGGFLGIGATKYYDRAKAILDWWIASFPRHESAPEARFTLGATCEKLKDKEGAKAAYQFVIQNYPSTYFAEEAKKRLKKLDAWYNNL